MRQHFTIIQGGLSEESIGQLSAGSARTGAAGWRVALRRASSIEAAELAAWRALASRQASPDPFADPDFLMTAARHAARSREIIFALAFADQESGGAVLGGVLPLNLPHAVWGGRSYRLWHPGLTPRPVEPVFDPELAATGIGAVLGYLGSSRPGATLRLTSLPTEGDLLDRLSADPRLRVVVDGRAEFGSPIPATQLVTVAARQPEAAVETIVAVAGIRDAVEHFLLLDARRSPKPLLSDPAAAATIRVATRLLARRGLVSVELGRRDGEVVSGAIRLGTGDARALWRSVNYAGLRPPPCARTDVVVSLNGDADAAGRGAAFELVAS